MKLIRLKPLWNCKLHLWYDDGVDGVVDLTPKHEQSVFTRLRDDNFLAKAKINTFGNAVIWDDDLDIDGDAQYYRLTNYNPFTQETYR